MLKKIIITWLKMFIVVTAITFITSLYFKEYEIKYIIPYLICTLIFAVIVEGIKEVVIKKRR